PLKPFGMPCASAGLGRCKSQRLASDWRGVTQRHSRRSIDASPNARHAPVRYARPTNLIHINNPELAAALRNSNVVDDQVAPSSPLGRTDTRPTPCDHWPEPCAWSRMIEPLLRYSIMTLCRRVGKVG